MSELITIEKMTSMEIAEVTGKQHPHVMRDIRDEIERLVAGDVEYQSKFGLVEYIDAKGEKRPCYQLSKEGVLQLAARYDAVTRAKLIELAMKREDKPLPVHIDSKFLFSIAAQFEEKERQIEEKDKQIAIMKPKNDYFDNLVERNLLTNFRDTAKEVNVKETDFIEWLLNKGYVYRDSKKKLKPYAQYVPSLFQIKEYTTGLHAGNQTLITPKGRETFRLLLT